MAKPQLILILAPILLAGAPGLDTVVLDPGHGGADPHLGAPNPFRPGRFEKQYTLQIVRRIRDRLEAAGVPRVVLTRDRDRFVGLKRRVRIANDSRADLFLSVHLNATEIRGPSGHETFILSLDASDAASRRLAAYENQEDVLIPRAVAEGDVEAILMDLTQTQAHHDAERLAGLIQRQLSRQSPFKNRGVKQAPFAVLKGASMPAVIVEVGFINHRKESAFITSEAGMDKIAAGIAEGVLSFGRLVLAPRRSLQPSHPAARLAAALAEGIVALRWALSTDRQTDSPKN